MPPHVSSFLFTSLLVLGSLTTSTSVVRSQPITTQTTAAARASQRQGQVRQVRPENYDLNRYPIADAHKEHWRNILWTTAIVEPQEPFVTAAIRAILALTTQPNLSDSQQEIVQMALQVGTQLYLSNPIVYAPIGERFSQTIERSPNPEWVAMALSGLLKAGANAQQRQQWSDRIRQRFPHWTQNVHLYTTLHEVRDLNHLPAVPPLHDLLNWTIAPGQLHLYAICQPDRGVVCQTVLKDRHGEFVRQGGKLWSVPLSLRSLHGLSWNFTRGQTPQGIYRIEGTRPPEPETFRAYGQFPLVKLFVPYEEGVQEFIPGQSGTLSGGLAAYQTLLPPAWRNYFPIQQSYWAGRAGRSLFRIHGSGEDPAFFTNTSRYPDSNRWHPTIGCLAALELYDDTGRLLQADMPEILSTLVRMGGQNFTGYLTVVEVPGVSNQPISLHDIERAIAGANLDNLQASHKLSKVSS
jgi:hypothetical protein